MPCTSNVDAADVFHGTIFTRNKLHKFHIWVYTVCVLDTKLSNCQKLPCWQPDSRHGIFLGYSPTNYSDVPFVPKLTTGNIYPLYHVVFNETFNTVQYIYDDEYPPVLWNDAAFEYFTHQVPLEPGHSPVLYNECLTPT